MIGSYSNYIKSTVIATTTSDNRVTVTRTKSKLSINTYTIINIGTRRSTTYSICRNPSLGLMTKVRVCKVAGQD
jgi:hypothetical protein